jgi:uncharacterized protein (DUF1697 family)
LSNQAVIRKRTTARYAGAAMNVMICLLRGVNLAGHKKVPMEVLRNLCTALKHCDVQTYVQSGNVVFRTREQGALVVAKKLEKAIEKRFGFRSDVFVRTPSELKDVIARNPFAKRSGIEPGKLLVTFLAAEPAPEVREAILRIKPDPEEVHLSGRELYVYYPDGIGRSRLSGVIDKALQKIGTARNWNTVTKLLEMAEKLEDDKK